MKAPGVPCTGGSSISYMHLLRLHHISKLILELIILLLLNHITGLANRISQPSNSILAARSFNISYLAGDWSGISWAISLSRRAFVIMRLCYLRANNIRIRQRRSRHSLRQIRSCIFNRLRSGSSFDLKRSVVVGAIGI